MGAVGGWLFLFKILLPYEKESKHKGHRPGKENIMNELWQSDEFVDDNTLTVNINRLRKKLESIGVTDFLLTRRGRGYIV